MAVMALLMVSLTALMGTPNAHGGAGTIGPVAVQAANTQPFNLVRSPSLPPRTLICSVDAALQSRLF
jgi:hypothetical protein